MVCSHPLGSFAYTDLIFQTLSYYPYLFFYRYFLLLWHNIAPPMFDSVFSFHCLS